MLEEQSGGKAPKETCEKEDPVELKKEENVSFERVNEPGNRVCAAEMLNFERVNERLF